MNKCFWKNDTDRFARCRVATNFQFVKIKLYVQSSIKQSAIKLGMPVKTYQESHLSWEEKNIAKKEKNFLKKVLFCGRRE